MGGLRACCSEFPVSPPGSVFIPAFGILKFIIFNLHITSFIYPVSS
jgi:hypothetical protein